MLDFLILYEHKARELDNVCLIRAELEKRGYRAEIVNTHEYKQLKYVTYRRPKVVITPYLYDNVDFYDYYSRIGKIKKLVNLQWEQVLSEKGIKRGFHNPREDARLATHICWGNSTKKRLHQTGVKNAIITGPIQMDFLLDEFGAFYKSKDQLMKEFHINPKGNMVLYISSFTFTTMKKSEIRALENRVSDSFKDLTKVMIEAKVQTLDWIDRLLSVRQDITFIYRPHPAEKKDKALTLLKQKHSNFKVIEDYSVKQWILTADTIMTWMSTAIVEVYYAGKKCSILRPNRIPQEYDALIYKDASIISDFDQLLEVMQQEHHEFPISSDMMTDYYNVKRTPSYIRVCNLLERILKTDHYDLIMTSRKPDLFQLYKNIIMDEAIMRFNLLNKSEYIINEKLKNRIINLQAEYERFSKEMESKTTIDRTVRRIRRIIDGC